MSTAVDAMNTALQDYPVAPKTPLGRNQKVARATALAAVAIILAMWIYAFGFASKDAVAKVSDTSWSKRAATLCEQRDNLLRDNATAARATSSGSAQDLGRAVQAATAIIAANLDEVMAVKPANSTDVELVDEFERLYRVYLGDRKTTTDKLLAGQMVELNETLENQAPVSKIIADFTSVNRMDSCQVPGF